MNRLVAATGDTSALQDVLRQELADPGGRRDPVRRRFALATLQMVREAAAVAAERDAYLAEVAASRARIVAEGAAQRRRLERLLHDGVQQSLLALVATLSEAKLADGGEEGVRLVDDAQRQLLATLEDLRRIARGVYPLEVAHGGLLDGVRNLVGRWPGASLTVTASEDALASVSEDHAALLYFVVAEALSNAHKHGMPPVGVTLGCEQACVTATITDAGPGGASFKPGGGLVGLRDRVESLGGRLVVESPPGGATQVRVQLGPPPRVR